MINTESPWFCVSGSISVYHNSQFPRVNNKLNTLYFFDILQSRGKIWRWRITTTTGRYKDQEKFPVLRKITFHLDYEWFPTGSRYRHWSFDIDIPTCFKSLIELIRIPHVKHTCMLITVGFHCRHSGCQEI